MKTVPKLPKWLSTPPGDMRLVLKFGSSLVVDDAHLLRREWMASIATDIAAITSTGIQVVVVSSGAVALGRVALGLGTGPLSLAAKQAAAATGQPLLMQAWQHAFAHTPVAQMLLSPNDTEARGRYLNARQTCDALLSRGVIPIVNENDTVATQELKFGDNDRLAARVAVMIGARGLVLFSDVDGLYDANPQQNFLANHIAEVHGITPAIRAMAGVARSAVSSGGMATKLAAAEIATRAGCDTLIANGTEKNALAALQHHTAKATWFHARSNPAQARKQWILGCLTIAGRLEIDAGAARALADGKSLLPVGVVTVEGAFKRGDIVDVAKVDGAVIARGMVNFSATHTRRIMGANTTKIGEILGDGHKETLIHRDDLVMLKA
jgi:glutamate 5-kinase